MHACVRVLRVRWPQQQVLFFMFLYITFTFFIDLCVLRR